jgi:hypothetical protein
MHKRNECPHRLELLQCIIDLGQRIVDGICPICSD